MYRRGFLSSIGSVAAIPCVGIPKVPPKDWRCIIGGNRAGKSTKAAKLVASSDYVVLVARDERHAGLSQARIIREVTGNCHWRWHAYFRDEYLADDDNDFDDLSKKVSRYQRPALWADECSLVGIEKIAGLFDTVVFSSWPSKDGILGTPFYEECLRMGTVERLPMLPHLRAKYPEFEQGLSPLEFAARIEGRFV